MLLHMYKLLKGPCCSLWEVCLQGRYAVLYINMCICIYALIYYMYDMCSIYIYIYVSTCSSTFACVYMYTYMCIYRCTPEVLLLTIPLLLEHVNPLHV